MDSIRLINITIQIWGIIMLLTIAISMRIAGKTKMKIDQFYLRLLLLYSIVLGADALAAVFRGRPGTLMRVLVYATNFTTFFASNVFALLLMEYVNEYIRFRTHHGVSKKWIHLTRIMFWIASALLVINLFCPFMYRINADNRYERMDMYPLSHVFYLAVIGICFIHVFINKKYIKWWEFTAFLVFFLSPLLSDLIVMFVYGFVWSNLMVITDLIVIYIMLQAEYGRQAERIEREIIEHQEEAMMRQIGPHFVFNALNTIEYLCNVESPEATRAIEHFTNYLRVNLESISEKKQVPFLKELEHVKNYLYIEQLRFPNTEVVYELENTDFFIPPLTLQPIVENSMKHGLRSIKTGGRVTIKTMQEKDENVILVQDNGIGFDVDKVLKQKDYENEDMERSHVGLENVRKRLELICDGTLEVVSSSQNGTIVTISIPKTDE